MPENNVPWWSKIAGLIDDPFMKLIGTLLFMIFTVITTNYLTGLYGEEKISINIINGLCRSEIPLPSSLSDSHSPEALIKALEGYDLQYAQSPKSLVQRLESYDYDLFDKLRRGEKYSVSEAEFKKVIDSFAAVQERLEENKKEQKDDFRYILSIKGHIKDISKKNINYGEYIEQIDIKKIYREKIPLLSKKGYQLKPGQN